MSSGSIVIGKASISFGSTVELTRELGSLTKETLRGLQSRNFVLLESANIKHPIPIMRLSKIQYMSAMPKVVPS